MSDDGDRDDDDDDDDPRKAHRSWRFMTICIMGYGSPGHDGDQAAFDYSVEVEVLLAKRSVLFSAQVPSNHPLTTWAVDPSWQDVISANHAPSVPQRLPL